eukprot:2584023-Pyramimonas_sp.AAC.1
MGPVFSFTIVTSNVTGLAGLDELLADSEVRQASAVCAQEHHQLDGTALEHRLRRAGWHARVGSAVKKSDKGTSGGVAMMTAAHGLSELEVTPADLAPGR